MKPTNLFAASFATTAMADEGDEGREGQGSRPASVPQKFLNKYQEQWPRLRPSKVPHHAFYTVCNYDMDIRHQGAAGNIEISPGDVCICPVSQFKYYILENKNTYCNMQNKLLTF